MRVLSTGARADGPESRGLAERCLVGFNSGPPMIPSGYNNHMQLVQTPDHVVILNEMNHDVRIIPLDGTSARFRATCGNGRACRAATGRGTRSS